MSLHAITQKLLELRTHWAADVGCHGRVQLVNAKQRQARSMKISVLDGGVT